MNKCYIIAAGDMGELCPAPEAGDLIIAADAGYLHLEKLGLKPDLLIGDFDSMEFIDPGCEILRFPVEKDDTDTMLAVKSGLERGFRDFLIYGALGGKRLDHSIANIQTLAYLNAHSARGVLVGVHENVALFSDSAVRFPAEAEGIVSVFAVGGKASGVTVEGLFYGAEDIELDWAFPLAACNKFIGKPATVSVGSGTLAVVWEGSYDWLSFKQTP